jgi:hypothetical protein
MAFKLYCEDQKEWPKFIPSLLFAYRSTSAVKSLKISPFEMCFGKPMRRGIDTTLLTPENAPKEAEEYFKDLVPRLELINKVVQENCRLSQQTNKAYFDKKSSTVTYDIGDKVWLLSMARKVGENKKMKPHYTGPYIITEKGYKNQWYKVRHSVTDKPLKQSVSAERLKKFVEADDVFYTQTTIARQRADQRSQQKDKTVHDTMNTGNRREIKRNRNDKPETGAQTIPVAGQNSDKNPSTSADDQSQWCPVKCIVCARGSGSKKKFLVKWDDPQESESWVRPQDVSAYAKSMFYVAQAAKKKRRRRRY